MSAIRMIPATDDGPFPYDQALKLLSTCPGLMMKSKNFAPLIAAGKRMGWSQEMIEEHERMEQGGLCFDFAQQQTPFLQGSLFEDNIYFRLTDYEHEKKCESLIVRIVAELGARVYRQ